MPIDIKLGGPECLDIESRASLIYDVMSEGEKQLFGPYIYDTKSENNFALIHVQIKGQIVD